MDTARDEAQKLKKFLQITGDDISTTGIISHYMTASIYAILVTLLMWNLSVLRKTKPTLYRLLNEQAISAIINNEILCKFRINQIINIKGNVETSRSVNENEKN